MVPRLSTSNPNNSGEFNFIKCLCTCIDTIVISRFNFLTRRKSEKNLLILKSNLRNIFFLKENVYYNIYHEVKSVATYLYTLKL